MKPKTEIQLKLLEAGLTQNSIAESTGITIHTVSHTLKNKSHNQAVQEYIAQVLNESPEQLWGDSYAPIYRKRRKQIKPNTKIEL